MRSEALFALLALLPAAPVHADVRLPAVFGDHMVLQAERTTPLWGWAEPGESVSVRASWSEEAVTASAGADGRFTCTLTTPVAGGPHTITLNGANELVLEDVLVGEVWLCSGQSNMEMSVSGAPPGSFGVFDEELEVLEADWPDIRLFLVRNAIAPAPLADCVGEWKRCSPETVGTFSAAGYFFGRELHRELGVPVGLIAADWGGTAAEAWTSREGLAPFEEFRTELARVGALAESSTPLEREQGKAQSDAFHANTPTALYNGMIAPLVPFGLRGAIWYQGESNCRRALQYRTLFPALIADWRAKWASGEFPFYFVQIAPFAYGGDTGQAAELRDAQRRTLSVPNTGMAVTLDIGDPLDIHPKNKQDVGRRLALWALARTYGRDIPYSGPLYAGLQPEGTHLRLTFDHAKGLKTSGGPPSHFEIAGPDGQFVPAEARIEGESIVVWNATIEQPSAARYAWGAADEPNLFNAADLPASSFTTAP